MSGNADLIAYLERRRRERWETVRWVLKTGAVTLLILFALVFIVTGILHLAGVGQRTQTTLNIGPSNFHVIRKQVGGVPILP